MSAAVPSAVGSTAECFERDGYVQLPSKLGLDALADLRGQTERIGDRAAGTRQLLAIEAFSSLVGPLRANLVALGLLTPDDRAVQCTLFRKSATSNWKVALHQDLSLPVAAQVEGDGLAGWSQKEGGCFVQPPVSVLRRVTAVRLHVDDCGEPDGPLRVVPGSHRYGRLANEEVKVLRDRVGTSSCPAKAGELLIMKPLLLHASSKAVRPQGARRVLHFVFGPIDPGYGLRWSLAL